MRRAAMIGLAAVATVGGLTGTRLVAQADEATPKPATGLDQLSEEAIVADWCSYLTPVFAEGAAMPSIRATVEAMLRGDATPEVLETPEAAETAPNPDAAAASAFLALVEGEPAAVVGDYAILRKAANEAVLGEPIPNAARVREVADRLDGYLASTCEVPS